MRIMTRSGLCSLVILLAAACGGGGETAGGPETPEPAPTPTPEPTPAAGEATDTSGQAATAAEPATPAEPPKPVPIVLKKGEASSEIAQVLLMKDPKKKGKDKLLFFSSAVTCDEIIAAKNKSPALVLATDVKAGDAGLELAQPMKLTYYKDNKPTVINAKKEEVTLSGEGTSKGTLKIGTKVGKEEVALDGPFEYTTCEPPEAPAKAPAAAKAPAEGAAPKPAPAPKK